MTNNNKTTKEKVHKKRKKYNYFVYKMWMRMLMGLLAAAGVVSLMLYLHSHYLAWDVMQFLNARGLYQFFLDNKTLIICVLFSVFICVAFGIVILIISNYLRRITSAVEEIFLGTSEDVHLPDALIEVEDQLNSINRNMKRKSLEAKESEQRKNDLIVYLAHDLKTPLASVIGYLNLLETSPELPTETRAKYVDISLERALRLEELINELFDITKFNLQNIELEKHTLNVSMMLRQMIEEFYPILEEKNLTIYDNIESNLITDADGDKLARVFDNLMRNAMNYSYSNTEIKINAKRENQLIVISITNHGDVIPSSQLNLIFEKFYRVDSARQSSTGGSGIGLAVAKEIVRAHDGYIRAKSDETGTTFTVEFTAKDS